MSRARPQERPPVFRLGGPDGVAPDDRGLNPAPASAWGHPVQNHHLFGDLK